MEIDMFKVVLINFNFAYEGFVTRYSALNRAEEMGYEASVYENDNLIANFSPISGWKFY